MAFPTSPTNNQTAVVNNATYRYNVATNSWTRLAVPSASTLAATGNISAGASISATGSITAAGALYTNGAQVIPTAIQEFTATVGQTIFTIATGYTVNTVQVFANGIAQGSSDFTASNGTQIILNQGRVAGDVIRVVAGISSTGLNNIQGINLAMTVALGS